VVQLFGGCPADTRIGIDSQLLHYQELTIKSTFHHTPESVRKAFRLIADGHLDPAAFITAEAPLEELPGVLRGMAKGGPGLKTAILPWGREPSEAHVEPGKQMGEGPTWRSGPR